MALDNLGRVLQSSHTLTQSEWQQGDGEGVGQLDHSTGSPSEQPLLWLRAAIGDSCSVALCRDKRLYWLH